MEGNLSRYRLRRDLRDHFGPLRQAAVGRRSNRRCPGFVASPEARRRAAGGTPPEGGARARPAAPGRDRARARRDRDPVHRRDRGHHPRRQRVSPRHRDRDRRVGARPHHRRLRRSTFLDGRDRGNAHRLRALVQRRRFRADRAGSGSRDRRAVRPANDGHPLAERRPRLHPELADHRRRSEPGRLSALHDRDPDHRSPRRPGTRSTPSGAAHRSARRGSCGHLMSSRSASSAKAHGSCVAAPMSLRPWSGWPRSCSWRG